MAPLHHLVRIHETGVLMSTPKSSKKPKNKNPNNNKTPNKKDTVMSNSTPNVANVALTSGSPTAAPTATAAATDPSGGEVAFRLLEKRLRAMPIEALKLVNLDISATSVAAFAAVAVMREDDREARVRAMPGFVPDTVSDLEDLAWCTVYLNNLAQNSKASANGQKVDVATVNIAFTLRTKMSRVLGYHFADDAKVEAELADIKAGSGHRDLAMDLGRLAELYVEHANVLAVDKVQYDREDVGRARGLAQQIMQSLTTALVGPDDEIDGLRTRSWSLTVDTYNELKAAHDWVNRKNPREMEALPTLRAAVIAQIAHKRKVAADDAEGPAGDVAIPVVNGAAPALKEATP